MCENIRVPPLGTDHDQTVSELSDQGLCCMSRPFSQTIGVWNFKTSTVDGFFF